jgi:hypothetical protein
MSLSRLVLPRAMVDPLALPPRFFVIVRSPDEPDAAPIELSWDMPEEAAPVAVPLPGMLLVVPDAVPLLPSAAPLFGAERVSDELSPLVPDVAPADPAAPPVEVCAIASGAKPRSAATATPVRRCFMSGTFPRGCLAVERTFFFINNVGGTAFRAPRAFV